MPTPIDYLKQLGLQHVPMGDQIGPAPQTQEEWDMYAKATQEGDPLLKQGGRALLEGGTDLLSGLIGLGPDSTMNQLGQVAGNLSIPGAANASGAMAGLRNILKGSRGPF